MERVLIDYMCINQKYKRISADSFVLRAVDEVQSDHLRVGKLRVNFGWATLPREEVREVKWGSWWMNLGKGNINWKTGWGSWMRFFMVCAWVNVELEKVINVLMGEKGCWDRRGVSVESGCIIKVVFHMKGTFLYQKMLKWQWWEWKTMRMKVGVKNPKTSL